MVRVARENDELPIAEPYMPARKTSPAYFTPKISATCDSLLHIAFALVVLALGGCGSTQAVRVVFEPRDSVVKVNALPDGAVSSYAAQSQRDDTSDYKAPPNAGVVPLTLVFSGPGSKYQIAVSHEGYKTTVRTLDAAAASALPHFGAERFAVLNIQLSKSYTVRFQADPANATLRLTDPDGVNQLIRSGQEIDLHLGAEGRAYKIAASADGYVRTEWNIDLPRVMEAIRTTSGAIRLDLPSEAFIDMRQLIVVYDPSAGFVGKYRSVRGWKLDTLAREKATRIVDLPDGLGVRGITVTPDGRQLVYAIAETGTPAPTAVDAEDAAAAKPVAAVNLKSSRLKSFTLFQARTIGELPFTNYIDTDPCFLSDAGLTLLFASNGRNRRSTSDILAVSQAAPDEVRILQAGTPEFAVSYPTSGADGTLAYVRTPNHADASPDVMIIDGKKRAIEARPAATKIANATQPRLSPDGSRIAYIDHESGNVMVADTAGGKAVALTTKGREIREYLRSRQPGYDPELSPPYSTPVWSPDGRFIVYAGIDALDKNGRPNEDLWLISSSGAHGAKPMQLTNDGSADFMPCWTRDNSIYFISNRGGKWAIYRMAPPGLANPNP
jgi:hypothetical protein